MTDNITKYEGNFSGGTIAKSISAVFVEVVFSNGNVKFILPIVSNYFAQNKINQFHR